MADYARTEGLVEWNRLGKAAAMGTGISDTWMDQLDPEALRIIVRADEQYLAAAQNRDFFEACTPGYYNNEGHLDEAGGINTEAYGPGINEFDALLADWREEGDLAGLGLAY